MSLPELPSLPVPRFQLPAWLILPAGLLLLIATYVLLFILPTSVHFSYAGPTCLKDFTFLPDLHQTAKGRFIVKPDHRVVIADWTLASRRTCFLPLRPPAAGQSRVSWSPYGQVLGQKSYNILVDEPPTTLAVNLDQPIPLSRPLTLPLTKADQVFDYKLKIESRQADCQADATALSCDLSLLNLSQGQSYTVDIVRYFADEPVEVVATETIDTLPAVTITDSSVQPGQIVYGRPTSLRLSTDKPLTSAIAKMVRLDDEQQQVIALDQAMLSEGLEIYFAELDRSANYQVTIEQAVADDGSTLAEPFILSFTTSGGPSVVSQVDRYGLRPGSEVTVSFDQPLAPGQLLGQLVLVNGQPANVRQFGHQIFIRLPTLPLCADVRLEIQAGMLSEHGIAADSGWVHQSRIACHRVATIGRSVQGRPILAYYFGSGPTTILFVGGIHGNEYSSQRLMQAWIQELEAQARQLPAGRQIVIIPVINPDGAAKGTRNNAHNVDLNRNFAVSDWVADVTDTQGKPIINGGGEYPMSEPETQALAALASQLQPRLTMSFHAVAAVVIANQSGSSTQLAARYSALSGYRHATGQSSQVFDYRITGTFDDWLAEAHGLPSVLVEMASLTSHEFGRNKAALWEMLRH